MTLNLIEVAFLDACIKLSSKPSSYGSTRKRCIENNFSAIVAQYVISSLSDTLKYTMGDSDQQNRIEPEDMFYQVMLLKDDSPVKQNAIDAIEKLKEQCNSMISPYNCSEEHNPEAYANMRILDHLMDNIQPSKEEKSISLMYDFAQQAQFFITDLLKERSIALNKRQTTGYRA